jgi:hypothetical protein
MGAQMEVPTEITLKGYKVKMYQWNNILALMLANP